MRKDNSYATRRIVDDKRVHEALTVAYKANGYNAFYQAAIVSDIFIVVASIVGAVLAGFIKADSVDDIVIGFSYAAISFFIISFMVFVFAIARNNKEYIIALVTDNESEIQRYSKILNRFDRINIVSFSLGLLWLLVAFIIY